MLRAAFQRSYLNLKFIHFNLCELIIAKNVPCSSNNECVREKAEWKWGKKRFCWLHCCLANDFSNLVSTRFCLITFDDKLKNALPYYSVVNLSRALFGIGARESINLTCKSANSMTNRASEPFVYPAAPTVPPVALFNSPTLVTALQYYYCMYYD